MVWGASSWESWFAQDKSGAHKSFRFDVANDGSYCVSRDGRVGQYKEFTDDGRAKPVGGDDYESSVR